MNLETELRALFGRTDEAPWPGERTAYDRFQRRRARRAVVAATGLALVAVLAGAVLVPRLLPSDAAPVAPTVTKVWVESQGYELTVPAGWRVERELRGTRPSRPLKAFPGTSVGKPRPVVVGLVLVPRSGEPEGARITVTTESEHYDNENFDPTIFEGARRRADGREYRLLPGSGPDEIGRYIVMWPDFCHPRIGCIRASLPRVLAVAGSAASGREQVLQAMETIVTTLRPITNSVLPQPPPTLPPELAKTKVLLAKGGRGMTAWELWIEPFHGNPGLVTRFPWPARRTPDAGWHWESLEPSLIQQGTWTMVDCLTWVPGSGVFLAGLGRKGVASVRFELAGRSPVTVGTMGIGERLPWVAYASPALPAGSRLERVLALDAAGRPVGEEQPVDGRPLCRPR